MIRYTKQHDYYSCGPAAVANAIKWTGRPFSYRGNKEMLCKRFGCYPAKGSKPGRGTPLPHLIRYLSLGYHQLEVKHLKQFNLEALTKHLDKPDGSAIIKFAWPGVNYQHYAFISGRKNDVYHAYNLYVRGSALNRIHRNTLKKLLARRKYAELLLLTKRTPNANRVRSATLESRHQTPNNLPGRPYSP